jgi:tetratricopeptide (TPR) repeat protein
MHFQIDACTFMQVIGPAVQTADLERLARLVACRWRPRQLSHLLRDGDVQVRRLAALVLGLVGDKTVLASLLRALHDADGDVHKHAEQGLWSIWFRTGSADAIEPFRAGLRMLGDQSYRDAIDRFSCAARIDPGFAEAFNQVAICQFFLCAWPASMEACCRTVKIAPMHFGAIAGMGHCLMEMQEHGRALECYRRALQINPRMSVIRSAVMELKASGAPG